jgi:predicted Fe-S protein YdhL (DUF1289 family)
MAGTLPLQGIESPDADTFGLFFARWSHLARKSVALHQRFLMRDIETVLSALAKSTFRRRFKLSEKDRAYIEEMGLEAIRDHARGFVGSRLAPADPPRDGKQTPFRGHPVFVAQHATATCCRGCLAKWHEIPYGHTLRQDEREHLVSLLLRWIESQGIDGNNPRSSRLI